METIYRQIVPFHACAYLIPEWMEELDTWHFKCGLPIGEPCHKSIGKRRPSKGCLIDEYEVRYRGH